MYIVPVASGDQPSDKIQEVVCKDMILTQNVLDQISDLEPDGMVWVAETGENATKIQALDLAVKQFQRDKSNGRTFTVAMYNDKEIPAVDGQVAGMKSLTGDRMGWSVRSGKFKSAIPGSGDLTHEMFARVMVDIGLLGAKHWHGDTHIITGKEVKAREGGVA